MQPEDIFQNLIKAEKNLNQVEEIEKSIQKECADAHKAVTEAEHAGKTDEEIKKLKKQASNKQFQVHLGGFIGERLSDQKDEILKKNLLLQNKRGNILILGHLNAGKTTLLNTLKKDAIVEFKSISDPNSEGLRMGKIEFAAFDLSAGHAQADRKWNDFFPIVDAIVFLVDATDRHVFPLAKAELINLLTNGQFANVPIAVLGTKNDLHEAVSEERFRHELGLDPSTKDEITKIGHPVEIFMCNAAQQGSFGAVFRWLSRSYLKDKTVNIS